MLGQRVGDVADEPLEIAAGELAGRLAHQHRAGAEGLEDETEAF